MEKLYAKGFKLDRNMIAKVAEVESSNNPEVDEYIHVIINGLNRSGYKFIGAEHTPPGQQPDGRTHLAVAIVLETGRDEEELRKKDLQPIDHSITFAQPHVLVGPDFWELWG
jgi:hypothetical protein